MKTLLKNGKEEDVFIEIIKERLGHIILSSDIKEPTEEEIQLFLKNNCDHINCKQQLVYDRDGWPYINRYCAVCNKYLGCV
ncbi:MAG: hypothetical protein M0Q13_11370 [Methanothrix sp.]|jgi:hypothetical protein|nr:hypothetical protein [Methanothrix sp.]